MIRLKRYPCPFFLTSSLKIIALVRCKSTGHLSRDGRGHGAVAQLVERLIEHQEVGGSNPPQSAGISCDQAEMSQWMTQRSGGYPLLLLKSFFIGIRSMVRSCQARGGSVFGNK